MSSSCTITNYLSALYCLPMGTGIVTKVPSVFLYSRHPQFH
jgi:hypothetical protein